jgi:hypothetical protein
MRPPKEFDDNRDLNQSGVPDQVRVHRFRFDTVNARPQDRNSSGFWRRYRSRAFTGWCGFAAVGRFIACGNVVCNPGDIVIGDKDIVIDTSYTPPDGTTGNTAQPMSGQRSP